MIVGFIGRTIRAFCAILDSNQVSIPETAFACSTPEVFMYLPRIKIQYRAKLERKSHILQAKRFCTAHTQIASFDLRNILTKLQKIEYFGPINTLMIKSSTIKFTRMRGIKNSHLKVVKNSEKRPSIRVIPVEIRISFSFTKPYLSPFWESPETNFQYISLKIKDKVYRLYKKYCLDQCFAITIAKFVKYRKLRNI